MIALLLAGSGFGYYALATFFVIVCILLIFIVVITPSSEGGMAAAFGGMGSDSFFGTKAHQHINKFMVFLAVAFLALAVFINRINAGSTGEPGPGAPGKSRILDSGAPPPASAPAIPGLPGGAPPPPPPPPPPK
ncbi:MAG TPA: preprotein translocase subunit SecG [Planctomycetota bacterium]|nr:preprotein translocase subunit SecG [Planctomycetota bacterium]